MRKHLPTILLVCMLVVGGALVMYPTVSDLWNSSRSTRAISSYAEQVVETGTPNAQRMVADARAYNDELRSKSNRFYLSSAEAQRYESLLKVTDAGMMGYIEIPKINCSLPIYHGTDEAVLQVAIGHVAGTSLPVGGIGTHCVLSGHRGLPSVKLFSGLDKLDVGDTFTMRVLDDVYTYEVDQILIVLPDEVDALAIERNKDLCTLVTCTPYGVNTHRLLVRGHRVANAEGLDTTRVTSDAVQVDATIVAAVLAVLILAAWFVGACAVSRLMRKPR